MARKADTPCAGNCGRLLWHGSTSLPPGETMCRQCRRGLLAPEAPTGPCSMCAVSTTRRIKTLCRKCYTRSRKATCVDCEAPCYGDRCRACSDVARRQGQTTDEIRIRRQALNRRRVDRDRMAPGLTITERKHLRAKWTRQRRSCTYCPALATQVDHIIPLALGGTNYIGNLAPACADCNHAKGDLLLIEWRTGKKKARRMRWVVTTRQQEPRPIRGATRRVYFPTCCKCGMQFTAKTRAKRFCSESCRLDRGRPRACSDCAAPVGPGRFKCDPCVATTRRIRKRNQKRRQAAHKRQVRAVAPPGRGGDAVAA